ncbi:N-acetylglucosamine-6-phosphate deacetylase-like isoform X2 [Anneissia japonica]|uniref:N-acetylglucosamine-6-phosphate deacetylase-like isoform X2 n=1 Tax=Anneissia japonica TaxID=1529436 RepID=UPI0014256D1D|nr:N-acetylglucosamine-6-phosphate deacetylase-like isoform X2 [Anneissia japonica]
MECFTNRSDYTQQRLPKYGVTSFLATMVFPEACFTDGTLDTIKSVESIVGETGKGAVCEGIHAEGPIVNDLGGLPKGNNQMAMSEFTQLLDSMPSCKLMTISPHIDVQSGYEKIKSLVQRGIVPSLGHDRVATEAEILGAIQAAHPTQCHITHLFNVTNFHHRTPSLVNFGLIDVFPNIPGYERLAPPSVEIIGDMCHVHPLTVGVLLKARHYNQIAFISDCTAEPVPAKKLNYSGRTMEVSSDGKCLFVSGTSTLAGSCCTSHDAFKSLVKTFHLTIGEASRMVSQTPASIANLKKIGKIEIGHRADIVLMDENLNLKKTFIAGKLYYDADN